MVDAGYRWAYWTLQETDVVQWEKPVSVAAVLQAHEYWNPSPDNEATWLTDEIFPAVRAFLETHGQHLLRFGPDEYLIGTVEDRAWLEWLYLSNEALATPRYFSEVLNLRTWQQVESWVAENYEPWWWTLPEERRLAQLKFAALVAS